MLSGYKRHTHLQMACKSDLLANPDEPLRRVILIPFDSISVVHGELVVEIVVAFTNGDEGGDNVVARGVLVIEGSLSEPMSEGINTERRLKNRHVSVTRDGKKVGHLRGVRNTNGEHQRRRIRLEHRPSKAKG